MIHYRIVAYDVPLSPERPWDYLAYSANDRVIDWLHVHVQVELGVCSSGRGSWVIGDRRYRFSAGSVVVIAPGIPHFGTSDAGVTSKWEFLLVDPLRLVHGHQTGREILAPQHLADPGFPAMLDPGRHAEACLLIREAIREAAQLRPGQDAAVRGLYWAAMARLHRLAGEPSSGAQATTFSCLRAALARVADQQRIPPTVPELAALCRISEATLLRRFHAAVGISPKAYIDRIRILRAARRLQDTKDDLLEVALDAGFSSTSGFNRQFKAVLGMVPGRWRRQAVQDSAPR